MLYSNIVDTEVQFPVLYFVSFLLFSFFFFFFCIFPGFCLIVNGTEKTARLGNFSFNLEISERHL